MDLEQAIDELYQQPLSDFTSARNALAKTLSGDPAKRVRALAKPTVPAWTVNQLYWRDRRVFDRLVNEGARLRNAQIAALQGRPADVRAATEAHRAAIAAAVQNANEIAREADIEPDADALARTLEALSLSPPDATPGRLTRPLQPAGFEALTGITLPAIPSRPAPHVHRPAKAPERGIGPPSRPRAGPPARVSRERETAVRDHEETRAARRAEALARQEARRQVAAAKAAERHRAVKRRAAERALELARRDEQRARHALALAEQKVAAAELKLRAL